MMVDTSSSLTPSSPTVLLNTVFAKRATDVDGASIKDELKLRQKTEKAATKEHKSFFEYFIVLKTYFGLKFLFFLVDTYVMIRGFAEITVITLQFPMYKKLGFDSQQNQVGKIFAKIAWSIKGPIGVISDTFPLFGYHKRSYMGVFSVISLIFTILLATLPTKTLQSMPMYVGISFLVMNLAIAAIDLLCEGKYTQIMMENPETKANIVTYVWFFQFFGKFIAGSYIGAVIEAGGEYSLLWTLVFYVGQILVLIILNVFDEGPVEPKLRNKFLLKKFKEQSPFMFIAIFMGVSLIIITFVTSFASATANFILQLVVAAVAIVTGYLILPKRVAHINTYMFLHNAFYPSLGGALEYWYTAGPHCVPGGPYFTQKYYQNVNNLIGHGATLCAIVLYQIYFVHWKFRTVYLFSTLLVCLASFNDYIILRRWNINYLHISDTAMYLIGDGIVQHLVSMLNFLPGTILLSRVCPRSIESTAFAILAGFANYGTVVQQTTGKFIQEILNINLSDAKSCSYDRLPEAVLICAVLVPIISLGIILLLPPIRAVDPISWEELDIRRSYLNMRKQKGLKADVELAQTSEKLEIKKYEAEDVRESTDNEKK